MSGARPWVTFVVAVAALIGALFIPESRSAQRADPRPNIVIILSDDQSPESLPHQPAVMPYLQGQALDPQGEWVRFTNAFLNTPLCCPSRASILTGMYSHQTHVETNFDGHLFDDSSTVATWLHGAGYTTGLVGKYLNGYPFGRAEYIPPGWDRWDGKEQGGGGSVYYDYTVLKQGFPVAYGGGPGDYGTDVYASLAVNFIRTAPTDKPFFLYFAPTAPHPPWTPPPRYESTYASMSMPHLPDLNELDVSDKPAWVRALPSLTPEELTGLDRARRLEYEALLGVDDAVRNILQALTARGELENTVIFYLTDNGFSFGEHRWVTKDCAYEECIHTPFLVRFPGAVTRMDDHLVSNVDLAPTLAELADTQPGGPVSGRSIVPLLQGRPPPDWRSGVLLEWAGDDRIPPWWGVRTQDFLYVELDTGERELYDLRTDPFELVNVVNDPSYENAVTRLSAQLAALKAS
jgi:N-acetylglucosamine-6-sulfatase